MVLVECRNLDQQDKQFDDMNSLVIAVAAAVAKSQREKSLLMEFLNRKASMFSNSPIQNQTVTLRDVDRLYKESGVGSHTRVVVQSMDASGEK